MPLDVGVKKIAARVLTAFIAAAGFIVCLSGQTPTTTLRPKLIVLAVVDQMRADYLQHYDATITGGFRRLTTGGAVYSEAYYPYASTETAQGHATMVTGQSPSISGLVGDTWFDRGRHVTVTAGESRDHNLVGGEPRGGSPEQLLVATIGDAMKQRDPRSLVMTASWKRYAALLMAGHHGDAAYWFDTASGHMVTSDYYTRSYPAWVDTFNRSDPTATLFGKEWLGHKLGTGAAPDAAFRSSLGATPFSNDMLLDFSTRMLTSTALGQDEVPDFLGVSFSAVDLVGHTYGPDTPELDDTFLQMDRQIGAFMQALDARVGAGNWTMALLADHGAAELPERVTARGGDAGRLTAQAFYETVARELTTQLGPDASHVIESMEAPEFYLNYPEGSRLGIDAPTLERAVAAAALKQPGIARVYTRNEIMSAGPHSDPMLRAIAEGFNAGRSGDVYMVVKPNYIFWRGQGTTHGTPYEYDQHVPLIFYGAGILKGSHAERVTINDLAPTLSALAGAPMPGLPGHVLMSAMEPKRSP